MHVMLVWTLCCAGFSMTPRLLRTSTFLFMVPSVFYLIIIFKRNNLWIVLHISSCLLVLLSIHLLLSYKKTGPSYACVVVQSLL
jgi:hypothetical protein